MNEENKNLKLTYKEAGFLTMISAGIFVFLAPIIYLLGIVALARCTKLHGFAYYAVQMFFTSEEMILLMKYLFSGKNEKFLYFPHFVSAVVSAPFLIRALGKLVCATFWKGVLGAWFKGILFYLVAMISGGVLSIIYYFARQPNSSLIKFMSSSFDALGGGLLGAGVFIFWSFPFILISAFIFGPVNLMAIRFLIKRKISVL